MVEMFVRDIQQGIAHTGIKAGVLKCATDLPGVTEGVDRVLRAVAQAHRRTGAPITTPRPSGAWSNRRYSATRASICPG